jgi:putative heme iron utilization protein
MHAMNEFNPAQIAKRLVREARIGALATLLSDGAPFVSLVTTATLPDGSPLLLLSRLARHSANIANDPRVSLLLAEDRAGGPLEGTRVSISGKIARTENSSARRRFLARHSSAVAYAKFADFGFWRIEISNAHLISGFGRIVDLKAGELQTDLNDAENLLAAEEGAVDHMNRDHRDAVELYATRLLGASSGSWRITSLDPEGCDLMLGNQVRRLEFPNRITSSDTLRKTIVALVEKARES